MAVERDDSATAENGAQRLRPADVYLRILFSVWSCVLCNLLKVRLHMARAWVLLHECHHPCRSASDVEHIRMTNASTAEAVTLCVSCQSGQGFSSRLE